MATASINVLELVHHATPIVMDSVREMFALHIVLVIVALLFVSMVVPSMVARVIVAHTALLERAIQLVLMVVPVVVREHVRQAVRLGAMGVVQGPVEVAVLDTALDLHVQVLAAHHARELVQLVVQERVGQLARVVRQTVLEAVL